MKLLVAEDQASSRLFLCRLLEYLGHEVTPAVDGAEAWRIAAEQWFPVVISDWVMPELDGLELCRKIRGQVDRPYSYLMLLTSRHSRQDRLEGLWAGADDFLVKPPDADELVVRLEIARRILAVQDGLQRQNALLAELAHSDELTGLTNRRWFREALDLHFAASRRLGLPLSLVILDVDRFKSYNDAFGHPAGDEILKAVAGSLRDGVRRGDEVARIGGEEFAVLLPDTSDELARELAERLRAGLVGHRWPVRPVTASFGIASLSPSTLAPADLVEQADRALYASKRTGRDRVTHFRDVADSLASLPGGPGLVAPDGGS